MEVTLINKITKYDQIISIALTIPEPWIHWMALFIPIFSSPGNMECKQIVSIETRQ